MNTTLFLVSFLVLGVIYFIVGLLASKKISTNEDYFLAGRELGVGFLTFTLIATHLGGGAIIGTAKEAYEIGYAGILYNFGIASGLIILGLGFAGRLRGFNVSTVAELFEVKYNSPFLRKVASFLSAVSFCGILAGLVIAAKGSFLGVGVTNEVVFLLFWGFVVAYTIIGGLKAVVATDFLQVIVIISVFVGIFAYSLYQDPGSLAQLSVLNQAMPRPESLSSSTRLFSVLALPILLAFVEQDLAQRFFAAKTKAIATASALFSGIAIILFSFIPVYFGMKARLLNIAVPAGANPLVAFVEATMNEFVVVLVLCALFAAIVSTADSILCAISSNIAQDFEFKFLRIKNRLAFSKLVTFLAGIVALAVAYFFDSVIEVYTLSYDLLVSSMLVSVMFCFFKSDLRKSSALLSVGFGFVGFVVFKLFPPVGVPTILCSLVVSLLGYLLGPCVDKSGLKS